MTNVIKQVDQNSFTWQTIERTRRGRIAPEHQRGADRAGVALRGIRSFSPFRNQTSKQITGDDMKRVTTLLVLVGAALLFVQDDIFARGGGRGGGGGARGRRWWRWRWRWKVGRGRSFTFYEWKHGSATRGTARRRCGQHGSPWHGRRRRTTGSRSWRCSDREPELAVQCVRALARRADPAETLPGAAPLPAN